MERLTRMGRKGQIDVDVVVVHGGGQDNLSTVRHVRRVHHGEKKRGKRKKKHSEADIR